MKKETFATYGALFGPKYSLFYCFDHNKTNIIEFIEIEALAQYLAIKNEYNLFKIYDTYLIDETIIGLN